MQWRLVATVPYSPFLFLRSLSLPAAPYLAPLPPNTFAETVADINGQSVHGEGHGHEHQTRSRGVEMKFPLGTGDPVKHLDRHDRKGRHKPFKGNERKLRCYGRAG